MSEPLKIAIIGGGLVGLSTADSLIQQGAKVTIYEKDGHVGHGAGRYNSGMIHPSQAMPWFTEDVDIFLARKQVKIAEHSRDLLMKRRRMLGCDDIDRASGTLQLFDSPKTGQDTKEFYGQLGVACTRYEGKWSFARYALRFPDDRSGNAHHYCLKLADDLKKRGCNFMTGKPASIVKPDDALYVRAGNQSFVFDRIIIAAGAASKALAKPLGVDIPVEPVQGHALIFARPDCELPDIPIMHWESRSALTVFEDHVRLSGTVGEEKPQVLFEIWAKIAPKLVKSLGAPLTEWSADRPMSKRGKPIIGFTSIPHLWVNTGHGHMGWSLCSWSGEMIAGMTTGQDKTVATI